MLLTGLLPMAYSAFCLYYLDHLPRCGAIHNGLGSPTSVINQENASQTCPLKSDGGSLSRKVLSPQRTSLCHLDKLTSTVGKKSSAGFLLHHFSHLTLEIWQMIYMPCCSDTSWDCWCKEKPKGCFFPSPSAGGPSFGLAVFSSQLPQQLVLCCPQLG